MKCEICKRDRVGNEVINICLNIGYMIGDFAKGEVDYEVKPQMTRITSIYSCLECKSKIKRNTALDVDILPKIKKYLTKKLIKELILESLK